MNIRPNALIANGALADLRTCLGDEAAVRWLLVDTQQQHLWLMQNEKAQDGWPVSTSAEGLDNRQDSGGTPPGVHCIAQKVGQNAPRGTVFSSRVATGDVWQPGQESANDLILTRVLTLQGCEQGLNLGDSVDSLARYIYLHGTNHESQVGLPVSHGCVRLKNDDICDVFERVSEGDPVVIV